MTTSQPLDLASACADPSVHAYGVVLEAVAELNRIFEALLQKVQDPARETPFAEITDDDIDNLFSL